MRHIKTLFVGLAVACAALLVSAPAAAGLWSNHAENHMADCAMRGQACAFPATLHWGFTTDVCDDVGPGTEPSGGAYARVAVAASMTNWSGTQGAGTTVPSSGTSGQISNNIVLGPWPTTTASWGTLLAIRAYDASSGGNQWVCINFASGFDATSSGITISFDAGNLTITVDN